MFVQPEPRPGRWVPLHKPELRGALEKAQASARAAFDHFAAMPGVVGGGASFFTDLLPYMTRLSSLDKGLTQGQRKVLDDLAFPQGDARFVLMFLGGLCLYYRGFVSRVPQIFSTYKTPRHP